MKTRQFILAFLCGFGILLEGTASRTWGLGPMGVETDSERRKNLYSLNVRLSSRPIHPPKDLIKQVILLGGMKAARPRIGPSPQAAIIEDDQRRRVVILSIEETGVITAYVLDNLDLKPHVPKVADCAQDHHCADDRMSITGGLGCIAICVRDVLAKLIIP